MKSEQLLSFYNKKSIKDKYLKRVKAHRKADEIIKGQHWKGGKGCAIGCTIHSGSHDEYQEQLGISWRVALLQDSLFEKLPNDQAKDFPLQFLSSMPVGVDTDIIFKKFTIWSLSDKKEGLICNIKDKKVTDFLQKISDTYTKSFKQEIPVEVWKDLAQEANTYFSYAYAYAYAYTTNGSFQEIYDARILRMRDKLLELIKSSK